MILLYLIDFHRFLVYVGPWRGPGGREPPWQKKEKGRNERSQVICNMGVSMLCPVLFWGMGLTTESFLNYPKCEATLFTEPPGLLNLDTGAPDVGLLRQAEALM